MQISVFTRARCRHSNRHVSEEYDICITCLKPLNEQLVVHNRICTGEKSSSCDAHDKALSKQVTESKHNRTHKEEKSSTCSKCRKTFITKGSLSRHTRCAHESEKRVSSDNCNDLFVQKGNLLIHKGETYFTCLTCARMFSTKARLTTHIRNPVLYIALRNACIHYFIH